MKFFSLRRSYLPELTIGVLYDDFYRPFCFIIERPQTDPAGHPCIEEGNYLMRVYNSPTKGQVYQAMGVEGRSYIELHVANRASELLGCLAPGLHVGFVEGQPAVLGSGPALDKIKAYVGFPAEWSLTITAGQQFESFNAFVQALGSAVK